jgi:predicted RNA binding protein YcfA (HicA-like mRNA interferase family)
MPVPSDKRFADVRKLLEAKGYRLDRIKGSHHIFEKPGCRPFIVPAHGGKVKPGYVRQIQKL